MEIIDEILEFLHYHPASKRQDVEMGVSAGVSAATMKRILADGVAQGLIPFLDRARLRPIRLLHVRICFAR